MDHPSVSEAEAVANEALQDTASIHAGLKQLLSQEDPQSPSVEQLEQWKVMATRANKAISRLVRIAWMADDRRHIEMAILLETVKRDTIDREATFAHTWAKLRQHTSDGSGSISSVDRAQAATHQIESAFAALAPVPDTQYHGAPALALLQ